MFKQTREHPIKKKTFKTVAHSMILLTCVPPTPWSSKVQSEGHSLSSSPSVRTEGLFVGSPEN